MIAFGLVRIGLSKRVALHTPHDRLPAFLGAVTILPGG